MEQKKESHKKILFLLSCFFLFCIFAALLAVQRNANYQLSPAFNFADERRTKLPDWQLADCDK